jgi:two-component system NtrC family response regulator/two-component system response regulator HydG
MNRTAKLLFVDDEKGYRGSFRSAFGLDDRYLLETAADGQEALATLEHFHADIVLTDFRMPNMDGLTLLREIKSRYPEIFVLMLTGMDTASDAVAAMKAGAYDYILKPFDFEMIKKSLEKILAHKDVLVQKETPATQAAATSFVNIIGQDQKMYEIYEKISQVASSNASVLITGESGTGKELIAEAIHRKSPRKDNPFVQVNCAALTDTLINSELFGHEKGSFTGASMRKKGFFERADGGTIFLDEIGDIPMQTQVALLRVLELGTFQRVGGGETIKVDVRLICATNRDLTGAIEEKLFREDLYYRINVVSLATPSLRSRKSDIPLLADHFLRKYCAETGKKIKGISNRALNLLIKYAWPGNVRELANAIEHAVVFCTGTILVPDNLPAEIVHPPAADQFNFASTTSSLPAIEKALILKVLTENRWNLKQTADDLDVARSTLYSKLQKYGLEKPE